MLERALDRVTDLIVERPGVVVLAFLLATAVFAPGLASIRTEAGTDQFTQSNPAEQAFEDVNREFNPTFAPDSGSTQLIQSGANVLAKPALLRMLRAQERLADRPGLRVTSTSGAAHVVARTLDPTARTTAAKIRAIEDATPTEIDAAVRRATQRGGLRPLLSNDFNQRCACAGATIAVVSHELPAGLGTGAGTSGSSPLQAIQVESARVVGTVGGDITVFGQGIFAAEFSNVILDSLLLVVPAAVLLILLFLVYAYRDPVDLGLGVVSLVMAVVWTMGFMGLAGVPFTQMLIAVPPLLLAVGIDFGIHTVNRYREERSEGEAVAAAMETAGEQLLVAFAIVTGTTVIGFSANVTSDLPPIRDFGIIASVGIVFTFLLFGIFLPAAKVYADRARERVGLPPLASEPLGSEGSALGRVLPVGVAVARRAPVAFLLVVLVVTAGAAAYGAGVDTSFSQEDFLPPEETAPWLEELPEPFRPGEYTVSGTLNFLEANFESANSDTVTIYVEGPLKRDSALEAIHRAGQSPPDSVLTDGRTAEATSIVTVVRDRARADPEFRALVDRNDIDDDGIPEDNLPEVYDALFASPAGDRAAQYLTPDYRAARVVYDTEASASQAEVTADARALAADYRFAATATGQTVVFQAVADTIFDSAVRSLTAALVATAGFLVFVYWLLEREPLLGVVNLVPILVTVALLPATMRYFGVPFNALTATVLSIAIGLGVDYSAHFVHRFADEFDGGGDDAVFEALERTVRGTGGALMGSMLTTTSGIGVLVIAITPILGQFGLVTAVSIFYSFLTSVLVTPAAIVVWARLQ